MRLKNILLVFLVLIATGCSPAQRVARIVRNNPQLLEKQTITVRDTVITPEKVLKDTLVIRENETIVKTIDGTRLEIERNFDTIRIKWIQPADTIFIEKEVEVEVVRVYEIKREFPWWARLLLFIVVMFSLYWFLKWFGRKMS